MLTLTQRIILAYTLVFGLTLAAFAFVVYRETRSAETVKLDAVINMRMEALQDAVERAHLHGRAPGADLDSAVHSPALKQPRFRVVGPNGACVAGDSALPQLDADAFDRVMHGSWLHLTVLVDKKEYRCVWAPMDVQQRILYAAQIVAPPTDMEAHLRQQLILFAILIPALLAFTAVAAYLITRESLGRVRSMVETARSVSAGTLDRRLPVPQPHDEIRDLALTLNAMMERIDGAFNAQRRFVADAAHALRTPLTIIHGELEFAEGRIDGEAKDAIVAAREEAESLARLGNQLLSLARLDAGVAAASTQIRLDELVVDCVQRMGRYAAARQIDVQVRIDEPIELAGDSDRLREMVRNLLDNAIKYSPPKSCVEIGLCRHNSLRARISVHDAGPGIAADDLPRVFDRFYRSEHLRSRESGCGLGLAIVNQVARLHGGSASVESAPGTGSTFTVELPVAPGAFTEP